MQIRLELVSLAEPEASSQETLILTHTYTHTHTGTHRLSQTNTPRHTHAEILSNTHT